MLGIASALETVLLKALYVSPALSVIRLLVIAHFKCFLNSTECCKKTLPRKGKNAVQARKKLTNVYGEGVLTVRQCQNWFAKFRSGNFDVEDAPRSGRPVEVDKGIS
ncbi:histone-lysine N-methyltransferase SETMAR [Trichonephila clavipes]|uniref:Histone-lysine N-methyltransferase SETMAR n=1 Tax=Trichonephila clavipes TaxID=2585209 RepID=A0A8X6RL51_TRICX|nr:histone-lysine N-methyltransferase SETMAR [Trichonephila clavipes]